MPINEETLNKIRQAEENRTSMPTLDELLERLKILVDSGYSEVMKQVCLEVAAKRRLFKDYETNTQTFAAQAVVILINHAQTQSSNPSTNQE